MNEIIKQYSLLMRDISQTRLLGYIPLDIFLHFLLGYIIFITLRKLTKNDVAAFLILMTLEIFKEIVDSFSLTNKVTENITDFIATMILPVILILIKKNKTKKVKLN